MLNNREEFTKLLLASEGGIADHPMDSGGLTNLGITKAVLTEWRKPKPVTDEDVQNLTLDEAKEIIWLRYWNPIRGNDMVGGIDVYLCDFAFNSGVRRAVEKLQIILGFAGKDVDGIVGPLTLQKAAEYKPQDLLTALHDARMAFLRAAKNKQGELLWPTFGRGWTKRCADVLFLANSLLPAEAPALVAKTDSLKRKIATYGAGALTAIPLIVNSLPAAKDAYGQVQDTLSPFAEMAPWLPYVAGAGVMTGIIFLNVRNATMAHNAKVTGSQANIVAEPRMAQEAAT